MKKEILQEQIERMQQEIRNRGGLVHVSSALPPELIVQFLEEVLACEECGKPPTEH